MRGKLDIRSTEFKSKRKEENRIKLLPIDWTLKKSVGCGGLFVYWELSIKGGYHE
jgi:hypothetical protein